MRDKLIEVWYHKVMNEKSIRGAVLQLFAQKSGASAKIVFCKKQTAQKQNQNFGGLNEMRKPKPPIAKIRLRNGEKRV